MSAANASAPSPSIHEEMRAHEPSMEEILASIRRIIADDDTLPGARRERDERRRRDAERAIAEQSAALVPEAVAPEAALQPAPAAEEEPHLASAAKIRSLPLRLNRAPEPVQLVEETDAQEEVDYLEEPELSEPVDFAPEAPTDDVDDDSADIVEYEAEDAPLVSAEAASSVASQFQTLAASMILNDSGLLQKYAQEMLRPMLKQWLDDNLPVIVERLVRAEIERVARGGRR
ncbi:DUF2497 domain-containing protein [Methylocystis sp. JR02]|uniref:PopZ family protein n=1 Tax=Methylocystis sp. JR02 TaxID=3046284 RepID=UPI0024B94C50|nr:DUF2497 domain-containing protein [Methylocystis sp. JR02]MDJ0448090.1 DUF2497 domain-containing protein [Methylocystis sp. JR02]